MHADGKGFLEDLQALSIDLVPRHSDTGNIAVRTRQARHESQGGVGPRGDYRYRAGGWTDGLQDSCTNRNDHIRVPADDLASEIGIALGPPLGGISLDGEVLALDVAQAAQLCPKRLSSVTSRVIEAGHRTRSDDNRNPVLRRRFLRPARSWCGREQQTDRQIAPPHSMTSSASASRVGGMVRFSKRAVFKLM